jgi:hypothetical protein
MPRTRSLLTEASIGRIYGNIASISNAAPSNTIAGKSLLNKSFTALSPTATVVNATNIYARGYQLSGNGGIIDSITASLASAAGVAGDANLVITIKKGTTYAGSTVAQTVTIASNVSSASVYNANVTLGSTEFLYIDIAYSNTPKRYRSGLSVNFSYYPAPG